LRSLVARAKKHKRDLVRCEDLLEGPPAICVVQNPGGQSSTLGGGSVYDKNIEIPPVPAADRG